MVLHGRTFNHAELLRDWLELLYIRPILKPVNFRNVRLDFPQICLSRVRSNQLRGPNIVHSVFGHRCPLRYDSVCHILLGVNLFEHRFTYLSARIDIILILFVVKVFLSQVVGI